MGTVDFVFSNPGHHAAMMVPVVRELAARGRRCRLISLAELRGFTTPALDLPRVDVIRAVPGGLRKSPSAGASLGKADSPKRRAIQTAAWRLALGPRLRWLLRDTDVVVVPNDAAFPYAQLAAGLRARAVPFVLLQEGIRFPLPGVAVEAAYGRGGAAAVCCWGAASAEHFTATGVPPVRLCVTGNPRYDELTVDRWRAAGAQLLRDHGLAGPPLVYLSNPIDDQGFCTTADKMALFERFLAEAAPALPAGTPVVVKLHMREDAAAFRAVAERSPLAGRVHVLADAPLFAVLAAARAAVVLASTVGLEALVFGVPLGVLAVPGAGHVFEYVSGGAAVGLELGALAGGLGALLDGGASPSPRVAAFVERHLAHRGQAAQRVADCIDAVERTR